MTRSTEYNIIDRINLKDLSGAIKDFMKAHNQNDFNATIKIISHVLDTDDKDPDIKKLAQTLSNGADPKNNTILRRVFAYEKESVSSIMERCLKLEQIIRRAGTDGVALLEKLLKDCNELHFSRNELEEIKKAYMSKPKKENNFIGHLFVHAIHRLSINIPGKIADRLFHEALTLYPTNPMRSKLIKCAADCGHYYATLMYANEIYSDTDKALDYFLNTLNSPNPANALWEIAFMIENHKLTPMQVNRVRNAFDVDAKLKEIIEARNKIDDKDRANDEIANFTDEEADLDNPLRDYLVGHKVSVNEIDQGLHFIETEDLKFAYKIYLYVAKHDHSFPKAFNSLGKLLLGPYILEASLVPETDIDVLRRELAFNYLRTAMRFGNTNAMVNLAVYYLNHHKLYLANRRANDITDEEKNEMKYMFKTAADFDEPSAKYCLGELYLADKSYKAARECLEFSANPTTPKAYHELGKICATEGDYENAQKNLEMAINNGIYNAAYDLAAVYLHRYVSTSDKSRITYLQYGAYLLKTNISMMSDDYREKSEKWLAEWEDIT